MTLINLGCTITYPQFPWSNGTPSQSSRVLDAAEEGVGWAVRAPKTGDISSVYFRTGTVTTGADIDIRLETLTGGPPAMPSGTLLGTNTAATVTIDSADDNVTKEAVLTADASVTAGDPFAIIAYAQSGYAGNMQLMNYYSNLGWTSLKSIYEVAKLAGSWGFSSGTWGMFALKYADGNVYPLQNLLSPHTIAYNVYNSGSTPDEQGLLISLPMAARCTGVVVKLDTNDVGVDVVLYDSANNVLASGDNAWANGNGDCILSFEPIELVAGDYRVVMKPTSGSSITVPLFTVSEAVLRSGFHGGANCQYTSRTDAGSWTNSPTNWMFAALLLDQLDNGVGGGGNYQLGVV